jgi:hypothetical protein
MLKILKENFPKSPAKQAAFGDLYIFCFHPSRQPNKLPATANSGVAAVFISPDFLPARKSVT